MAGLEADTSSYNQPLPVSPLKQASEFATMQQQKLQIDQAKLDQANQGLTYMTRAMGALGPNAPKEAYIKAAEDAVKLGLVPPQAVQVFAQKAQAAPNSKAFYDEFMTTAADHQQQINYHIGQNAEQSSGAVQYQGVRRPASQGGGFVPATQLPVQPPPGTPFYEGGQAKTLGPAGPEGVQAAPRGLPVAPPQAPGSTAPIVPKPVRSLPVEPRVSGPTGPTIRRTDMEAGAPAGDRTKTGFNAAPPPNFETGQKQYAADQSSATAKATALKPLEEALDLGRQLTKTGVGTPAFNDIRARLTNLGVISADEKNPAVIYQMLNKNLAQFVDKNGSRSDADLAIKESSNANAKTQLQPALTHMVQKIIGRERIEIARSGAFEGSDYSQYGKHASEFPTSQDERAYSIDKMNPEDARQLYIEMKNNALNGSGAKKEEGIKFLKSLSTAKKLRLINGIN